MGSLWTGDVTKYRTIVADQAELSFELAIQEVRVVSDLAAGTAGEHLVTADLLLQGYRAILAPQHCPYDVLVEHHGRLIRVQVKSARQPTIETRDSGGQYTPAYKWSTRRAGKGGRRLYESDGFEVLALVALDIRRIAYLPWRGQQHVQMPAPDTVALPGGNGAIRQRRHDFALLSFTRAASA
jgi:hypothetical protein